MSCGAQCKSDGERTGHSSKLLKAKLSASSAEPSQSTRAPKIMKEEQAVIPRYVRRHGFGLDFGP